MPDPVKPLTTGSPDAPPAHYERVGERMKDVTELDNLQADIRTSGSKRLAMPWRTGRPLRSAGRAGPDGLPITPLADLDLKESTSSSEQRALGRELDRVEMADRISEGIFDNAEAAGTELVEELTDYDLDTQQQADEAEVAKQLEANKGKEE